MPDDDDKLNGWVVFFRFAGHHMPIISAGFPTREAAQEEAERKAAKGHIIIAIAEADRIRELA